MSAYRKFVDTLQSEPRIPTPPKPPKAPKANSSEPVNLPILGGLGALGEAGAETENPRAPADSALAIWGDTEEERAAIIEHVRRNTHAP